ncbi:Asparagine synthetase (glutamine-hydrolyzing) [Methanosarcina sp. MTP4]|uniref:asparagine synthetase B family protein n=1 Tax=Methanosarcina sp. MTP4 TaxID=1434100 RepID=UPI0006161BAA|nr:asparagine synthetase B [Methanosarcina sp. MTP4]AKB24855.1 Asparagine synthetase (glutamine-hydrolyzing) [Methanosarcina sp. MTP4]
MCGIAGATGIPDSRSGVKKMLEILGHRGPDACGIHTAGKISIGNTLLKITGDMPQPLVGRGAFVLNGEAFNFRELASEEGVRTDSDTELLFSMIEARVGEGKTHIEAVYSVLSRVNGDFALAYACGNELVLARDPVGVKPLFYCFKNNIEYSESSEITGNTGNTRIPEIVFASEKKAHHALASGTEGKDFGFKPFPPGLVLSTNTESGVTAERSLKIRPPERRISKEKEAVTSLREALEKAVGLRLTPHSGIAFSGGIDSALLAALARKRKPDLPLYAVGLPGSHDIEQAEYAAETLGLEETLITHLLSPEEIEAAVPQVIYATESTDPMKISIGLPLYIVSKIARENGVKVLLTGQGADELFGGYRRHEAFLEKGANLLDREIRSDLENISTINLERDDMVTMANAVELRVPFLDREVIKVGLAIRPELKVLKTDEGYSRKHVLRKAAEGLLSPELLRKEKKAMQYGTGVQKVLDKLARDAGFPKKEGKHIEKYLVTVAREKGFEL